MSLTQVTHAVMDEVQAVSGYPVVVQPDPSLKLLATMRMARGPVQFHTVIFNPSKAVRHEYLVCVQCGYILRAFSVPQSERMDLVGRESGRSEAGKLLENTFNRQIKAALGETGLARLRDQMFNGLLLQLRSIPIGLRVDSWILREYPQLAEQQLEAANRQLEENTMTLKPEVRGMTPPKIYRPSLAMNAAFADFWAERLQQPLLTLPYKASNFLDSGKRLISILGKFSEEPAEDRKLIDAWGEELRLTDWYEWIPHEVNA